MEQFNGAIAFAQSHAFPWPRDPTADPTPWSIHHEDSAATAAVRQAHLTTRAGPIKVISL
jgi:hypothetical protein